MSNVRDPFSRRPGSLYPVLEARPGRTLAEARDWLRDHLEDGAKCPACTQLVKVYRRRLNSGMAYALIRLYQHGGTEWVHKPTVLSGVGAAARDESLLRYWELLEEAGEERPDGGRAGWWRVTAKGVEFVHAQLLVPQYAVVFDGRRLRLEGKQISIATALGKRFDYRELMGIAL